MTDINETEYLKCKNTGECKFWTKVAYDLEVLRVEEEGKFPSVHHKRMWDELKSLQQKGEKYVLLTIRPASRDWKTDDEYDYSEELKKFVAFVNRITSKVWLETACWVYEQKGNTDETIGDGVHVHILCKRTKVAGRNKTKGAMIDEIHATADVMEFGACRRSSIDVTFVPKRDLGAVSNYLLGQKKCPKKQKCQVFDKTWRESFGLQQKYGATNVSS
jgi:hypothetical protein